MTVSYPTVTVRTRVKFNSALGVSGMGVTTYAAARILKGQLQGRAGEEALLTMDTFPSVGLAKVRWARCRT